MTAGEWIIFIVFTIAINVLLQNIAWKLGTYIGQKERKQTNMKEADNAHRM